MAQLVLKNILAGSGNVLAGGDNTGNVTKVTIGANLTLSGGVLSASGGGTGSVTSVALTRSGNALTITGSPITTSGTINIGFAGTTAQYIRGDGTLATFPATTGYVPYTGATQNVDLGEYELKAGQLTLDVSPTGTATVGTTRWNNTIGSSETTLKGGTVILKNGVDLVARVVNKVTPNATLTRAAYPAVRVSGAQGQRLAVAYAQANNDNNSADTLGLVIEDIATNQEGFIMTVGQLNDVNTTGSLQSETWADGDVLYLSPSTAGKLTNIKPNGSTGHIVVMGYVEYAHAVHGSIYVKVMNGWELDELHNVYISSVDNNQGLFYNSTSSLWENKSIATVLGYTPANDANVVKLTGNQTIGGVKTFSSESIFSNGISLTGGDLVLKSGDYNTTINTDTLTESRSILFPDNSGTVALLSDIDYPVLSVFGRTGEVVAASGDYDTDMVDEGTTNLYYTNARARAALSANTGSALTYNNTTGRFTLNAADSGVSGYLTGTDYDYFDSKQNSLGTGTTSQFLRGDLVWAAVPIPSLSQLPDVTITSPTNGQLLRWRIDHWENWTPNYVSATFFSATAPLSYNSGTGVFSISQATTSTNGYLSSTDWNTFNNKQDALTNPVTGTGATGYIAKWNTASTITNSLIYEASSKVGINTTNMVSLFDVTKNALGVTVVDTSGITLKNETEAITGNQQISPALHFKSNGWNNLAAASQSADWIEYSLPIQGNAVTSNLIWASSVNGAAYTTRFTLSSAGNGTFTGTLAASNLSGTNTGDVTIGTANGLSLSGQAISLALASTSTTGALSSTDWNTFNGKQSAITLTTTGSSGVATFSGGTLNIPNYGAALSGYLPLTGGTMSGGFSITNANSTYSIPSSTDVPNIYIFNSNSSSTTAHSILTLRTNLGGGGNPFISWDISGVTGYSMGIDNADSDKLKIAATWSNVASSTILTFTTAGAATFASSIDATSGTFTGNLTVNKDNGYLVLNRSATTYFNGVSHRTSNGNQWFVGLRETGTNNYFIYNETNAVNVLTLNQSTNAATFSNNIIAGGNITVSAPGPSRVIVESTTNGNNAGSYFTAKTAGGTTYSAGIYLIPSSSPYLTLSGDNNNTHLNILQNGNTGINTTSPIYKLNIVGQSAGLAGTAYINSGFIQDQTNYRGVVLGYDTSGQIGVIAAETPGAASNLAFWTYSGSAWGEKLRITSGGNIGVNITNPTYPLTRNGMTIKATGTDGVELMLLSSSDTGFMGGALIKSGNDFGVINRTNGNIIFATNAVERMYLTNTGQLLIGGITSSSSQVEINGGSTSYGGGNGHLKVTSGATGQTVLNISNTSVPRSWEFAVGGSGNGIGAGVFYIYDNTAGAARMTIATSGAVNFYSSVSTTGGFFEASDKRLKKEISDNPIINGILDIKPKLYIKDGKEELGYYAQELETILPSAVSEGKDGFLSLSYNQVHTAKIAELENKIEKLEELIKTLIK